MKQDLEALLFATDTPLGVARLKPLFPGAEAKDFREAVDALNAEYEQQGRAFTVVEFGGGWQLASRPEYAGLIQHLYRGRRFVRLSQAALEVLAVIAYRQPVTRMEIEEIRGVQVSGVLATLAERNLITVAGRSDSVGNPILYGTTREFLNHMGIKGLHQLPPLPELAGIIGDREEIKRFAQQLGEEITDEDFETVAIRGDEILVVVPDAGHAATDVADSEPTADEPSEPDIAEAHDA
ncbi:MAG: SMC-Scp complex subunit ScpB [Candidatus Latescibacteria bacterium]|nr:SMC-Scp complex subunit ScpB [Candidatus Latescibacterota bacterium]